MSFEASVYTSLSGSVDVTALVDGRIFPSVAPEDTLMPCVVYTVLNDMPLETLNGPTNLSDAKLQLDCFSNNYDQALDLVAKCMTAIRGDMTVRRATRVVIYESHLKLYRQTADFDLWISST